MSVWVGRSFLPLPSLSFPSLFGEQGGSVFGVMEKFDDPNSQPLDTKRLLRIRTVQLQCKGDSCGDGDDWGDHLPISRLVVGDVEMSFCGALQADCMRAEV